MSTSRDDTQSVHTSRTPHSNAIDLTDDQEDSPEFTIHPPVAASTSSRASGQPQRPAPAPTDSGSVRVKTNLTQGAQGHRKKKEKSWLEPLAQASSNMAHRPKGTAFKPEDPERKNRHTEATALPRNASGNIYGQVSNMDGKGKKDRATAQRLAKQKNKSLLVPGNTDRIMQQATKPKVLYASSVAGMGRIPKKSNVSDHSRRSSTEDDDSHAPQASTSHLPDDRPHEFNIKGAAGPPRAAISAASNGNGKGKGKAPEVLDLADSDADVDPIEDDSPPPNMSSSHRHRDTQRVYEAAPTGGHSSPDPLTLVGTPPFNLTGKTKSGQYVAWENRHTSKSEAASMHGMVQSGVEQFGGGVGVKAKVVNKMQGKRPTAPQTAEERKRRANGEGDPENEFNSPPAPASKSNKSKAPRASNSVATIVSLPVQLYMIAMQAVPIRLQNQIFFLAYNPGGHLDNQTVSICKGTVSNSHHTIRRSSCNRVTLSDLGVNPERPIIRFDLKAEADVFKNMLKECDVTERQAGESTSLVIIFEEAGLGDGTEIKKLFEHFWSWREEPNKILVFKSPPTADQEVLDKYDAVLAKCFGELSSKRTSNRTAAANGVTGGSGSAGAMTVTQKRIPGKAIELGIKQQTTLGSYVASTASTEAPRRSSRASTSAFASNQPRRAPTPEIDRVPPDKVVLVYPIGEPTGVVSITHGDTKRLQDGEFLNDTLIEFGLKHIHRQLRDSEEARGVADDAKRLSSKVHMFNSFFYKKLTQKTGKKTGGKDNMKIDAHATVKKWTSKIDIFEQDFVVVPINEHLHWYLAVIVNPGAALKCATSKEAIEAAKEPKAPSRKSARQEEKQQGASSPGSRVASNEPPPSLSEPVTTSHFFAKHAKSAPTPMDVDDDDTAQEELERQEEARIATQISAAAAQTEMGAEDGDIAVRQEEGGDSDVVMEDVATRGNSPMSHRSGQAGVESSSEDDEALVAGQLRQPSAAQPFQGQDRVRPPTPPHPSAAHASPLKRVPTPIEPSKFAPGDKAPPPVVQQAQDSITVDDEDEQPARAAGLSLTHKKDICYVYTFDSLGTRHVSVIRNLLSYLAAEALDKKKIYIDVDKFTLHGSMGAMVKVPQQDNFSDCGLYVLHYVEKLLERPDHMLQHIASIPDKSPKDKAAEVDQLVQAEWDGHAAAGKRKALREEVAKLCEQWAKYREPLEKEEAKEREEKARKKQAKREEQQAMAIARMAELAEDRSRAASGSVTIDDDDRGDTSSMIVGDDAAAVAAPAQPAVEDDYVDSPAPSAGSARSPSKKGRKGGAKGRGKKGPKAAKKPKEVEVLELSSDDDASDDDLPAPRVPATAFAPIASTSASTANGHKKPRGSEASTFVPTVAHTTTTSPKQTPPPEVAAAAARSHHPPPSRLPPPGAPPPDPIHTSGPSFSNGRGSVDVDVHYEDGDLETPEPESQAQQQHKRTTRHRSSVPAHDDAMSLERVENSPPPKKRLRRGAETKKEAAPFHTQAEAGSAHSSRTRGEPYTDTPGISAAIPLAEEVLSRQHGEGQQRPAPQQPAMSTASYPRLPSVDPALEIALEIRGKSKGKGKDKGKGLQRADSDQRIFFDEAHGPQYDGQHDDSGDILVLSSPNQSSSRKPPEPSPELCAPPQTHQQHQALYDPTSPQARSPRPRQTARNPRASGSSADFFPPEQSHSPLRQRPLVQAQQQQQHQYVAPGASSPVRIVEHVVVPVGVGGGRRGGGRGREGVEATEVVTIDDDDE